MKVKIPSRLASMAFLLWASTARGAEAPCAVPAQIGDGWEVSTPSAGGFDAAALCAVLGGVAAGSDNFHGVVVERHGKLVAELYRAGPDRPIDVLYGLWNPSFGDAEFGPRTLHDVRSISKSVVGLLVGNAMRRGEIGGVETPVLRFYPELADLEATEAARITLGDLLSMSRPWSR